MPRKMASLLSSNLRCSTSNPPTIKTWSRDQACGHAQARSLAARSRCGSNAGSASSWRGASLSRARTSDGVGHFAIRACSQAPSADFSEAGNERKQESGRISAGKFQQVQQRESPPDPPLRDSLAKLAVCVLAVIIACSYLPQAAHAIAENSIGASHLGVKVAEFLRGSGLSDEVVVFVVAMLPILELRGAIPISYWLKLPPLYGYGLSVIGNMVPVPFILLYLEKVSNFVGEKSKIGKTVLRWVFEMTRQKTGPIVEFHWLGLLLFVAVPLPGTGAWSGAIAACILGMPFWDAMTANFLGVAVAGLLVSVFVTVGAKEAFAFGALVFAGSLFMWNFLRMIQQNKTS